MRKKILSNHNSRCKPLDLQDIFMLILLFFVGFEISNAQITNPVADQAYSGFNDAFIHQAGGLTFYKTSLNNAEKDYFWQQALDIQSAQDNYFRTHTETDKILIGDLLNAFLQQNKSNNTNNVKTWEWNNFNDDLFWAAIAFCRGYEYTQNPVFLEQAEYGFNLAYYHNGTGNWGWDSQLGGGIWWSRDTEHKETLSNGPGIVTACYLYQFTGNVDYLNKAKEIYTWLRATLFNPNTGEVYGKIAANGDIDYSVNVFNNGSFGGAANFLYRITGDINYFNDAKRAFDYIKNTKFNNGVIYATNRGGSENAEYIRWLGEFVRQNHLWDEYYPWMKLNADVAWNMRRTDLNITWNDWRTQSPVDNSMANESNSAVVIQEVTPIVQAIPAKIEAENYNFMKGAVTEVTTDTGGGLSIQALGSGNYLEYVIEVPTSGLYVIKYRVASTSSGSVSLWHSGQSLSTTIVPNTGGNQVWQDVSTTVNLVKGIQSIRLVATIGGWSMNNFDITKSTDCDPTPIIAYQNLNNAGLVEGSSATLAIGETIVFAPEALDGSWSWTGPNGFIANTREIAITNIQINQGGTYRAAYTNDCGANSTQNFIVTVKPPCAPSIIKPYLNGNQGWQSVSNASLAVGQTIRFGPQSSDGGTWSWSGPNGFTANTRETAVTNIQTNQGGTYTATYTNICGTKTTHDFIVTVDAPCLATPIIPYLNANNEGWKNASNATSAIGGKINFGPQPNEGGQWSWSGPNGFNASTREISLVNIQANQFGTYIATHTNDCGTQSTNNFVISSTLSVSTPIDAVRNDGFYMYPNPNKGILNIEFHNEQYQSVNIFTITGALVYSKQINNETELKINLGSVIKSGVYLVSLQSKNKIETKKLIVR